MIIEFSVDAYEDALPYKIINELSNRGFSSWFANNDYGNSEIEIFMVFVCSPKELKLRKRFSKKEKVLYWDVMLDYKSMKKAKKDKKKDIVAKAIVASFEILEDYKSLHINKKMLEESATEFFKTIKWF